MSFGLLCCLNAFLELFTILPLKLAVASFSIALSLLRFPSTTIPSSRKKHLLYTAYNPLVQASLTLVAIVALASIDTSKIYHDIRRQSAIKLYVMIGVLDVVDKLVATVGIDLLKFLFNLQFSIDVASNNSKLLFFAKFTVAFALSAVYLIAHATCLIYQTVSLNVAVNSYSNALFTLLLSSQFSEIKSTVFKKFDREGLFQNACADLTERFQLLTYLFLIGLRNLVEFDINEGLVPNSFASFPKISISNNYGNVFNVISFLHLDLDLAWLKVLINPTLIVIGSELLVDWIKHSYIAKYNKFKPSIYERFVNVLSNDFLESVSSVSSANSVIPHYMNHDEYQIKNHKRNTPGSVCAASALDHKDGKNPTICSSRNNSACATPNDNYNSYTTDKIAENDNTDINHVRNSSKNGEKHRTEGKNKAKSHNGSSTSGSSTSGGYYGLSIEEITYNKINSNKNLSVRIGVPMLALNLVVIKMSWPSVVHFLFKKASSGNYDNDDNINHNNFFLWLPSLDTISIIILTLLMFILLLILKLAVSLILLKWSNKRKLKFLKNWKRYEERLLNEGIIKEKISTNDKNNTKYKSKNYQLQNEKQDLDHGQSQNVQMAGIKTLNSIVNPFDPILTTSSPSSSPTPPSRSINAAEYSNTNTNDISSVRNLANDEQTFPYLSTPPLDLYSPDSPAAISVATTIAAGGGDGNDACGPTAADLAYSTDVVGLSPLDPENFKFGSGSTNAYSSSGKENSNSNHSGNFDNTSIYNQSQNHGHHVNGDSDAYISPDVNTVHNSNSINTANIAGDMNHGNNSTTTTRKIDSKTKMVPNKTVANRLYNITDILHNDYEPGHFSIVGLGTLDIEDVEMLYDDIDDDANSNNNNDGLTLAAGGSGKKNKKKSIDQYRVKNDIKLVTENSGGNGEDVLNSGGLDKVVRYKMSSKRIW